MKPLFTDRVEAGRLLAREVAGLQLHNPLVLALPRGGVPVGAEIARALHAPLDLLFVRKIGVPWQPELAAAAIVDGDSPELVLNHDVLAHTGLDVAYVHEQAERELEEVERRRKAYLGERAPMDRAGRSLVVVDDGVATGTSMRAALESLGRIPGADVTLALPVAPPDAIQMLGSKVARVICLAQPEPFWAVGVHYQDFHQVSDAEVQALMR